MDKFSENISDFLRFTREVKVKYKNAVENLEILDKATQDCLHQLELGNSKDGRKILPELTRIRKARRLYKDLTEVLEPFYTFITQDVNVKMLNKLDSDILGKVRKEEKAKADRRYYPRILKELPYLKNLEEDCK